MASVNLLKMVVNLVKGAWRRLYLPRGEFVRTGLSQGYHDTDEVFLSTSFSLLVDFVDCEVASLLNDGTETKKAGEEALLAMIEEASKWQSDERENWVEMYELYVWWTKVRPYRADPLSTADFERCERLLMKHHSSILSVCDTGSTKKITRPAISAEDRAIIQEEFDRADSLYRAYCSEDTEMLMRLVKIRSFMWT
jgi:hypothetical protein